ncbi:olfactory receptor 1F1-like [Pleurodeles waltl]|uniref:olfactory receptor 1F1-like n=1 Tax=Pleurodeles waltl TaxID=8319 RepID=UPI003709554B
MEKLNQTFVSQFYILGLSQNSDVQLLIFISFAFMYLMTLLGNIVIITIIYIDSHLQKPMYYFLAVLSFLDICFTSVTVPKMLSICSTGDKSISFSACILQYYFCFSFLSTEFYLLSVMACDRYVAICIPLRYSALMSNRAVILLAVASWIIGFLDTIPHTVLMSTLSYCGSNEIDHFFCDHNALLKLSCTDTYFIDIATFGVGAVVVLGPFMLTITSYMLIISKIMKIPSTTGRQKAFSTCSSHLTAVVLFYGTEVVVYMAPALATSQEKAKIFTVLFTIVIPLLNPFIYSLRNKDVKRALAKIIENILERHAELHKVPRKMEIWPVSSHSAPQSAIYCNV